MTSRRSKELADFADYFLAMHAEWQADVNREIPDESYWDHADELIEAFEVGDVPDDCRALADAAQTFTERVQEYYASPLYLSGKPPYSVWEAVEAVKRAREPAKEEVLLPLESVKALDKQGVPHWQIYAIYFGCSEGDARKHAHLVQKEIDEPGSMITADWVDPRLRDKQAKREANESRHEKIVRKRRERQEEATATESIEELLLQAVSIEQICQMKGCSPDEVLAVVAQLDQEKEAKKGKRQKQEA